MSTGFTTLPAGHLVYYREDNGHMLHGENKINGYWYHFDETTGQVSKVLTRLRDGRNVYYDNAGRMTHGDQLINGYHYFFDYQDGHMITGLFFNNIVDGLQYYSSTGIRQNGNITINQQVLSFAGANDVPVPSKTGEFNIGNNWYYITSNGKVSTGLVRLADGREVYYAPSTVTMYHGELKLNGKWHLFDYTDGHEYINSFANLSDGRTTYYDQNGNMVYGQRAIKGHWYHFNEMTGAMTRGFYSYPNQDKSVYYDNNGQMVYGWHSINGINYYFQEQTGKLLGFNQRVIDWFRSRKGKLTYSMYGSRNGADGTADCSGSMTQAIRDAGGTPYSAFYNTESLHDYLWNNGYHLVSEGTGRQNVQYGDVIIWGRRGYSAGEGGHTLVISSFGNDPECISTSFWTNGATGQAVSELPYYQYWADDDYPYQYVYRQWNQGRA